MTIPFHPLATIFPPIEGKDFEQFVENIRRHGVKDKIVLLDGQVLEGRNRYRALSWLASTGELLGEGWGFRSGLHLEPEQLEPDNLWFTTFNPAFDGDPLTFVIAKNLIRRHLTESQRAMVAARIANVKQGERTDLPSIEGKSNVSQTDAAKTMNVSVASVERAAAVQANAVPEISEAVDRGGLAVSAAAEMAALPIERQAELLKNLPRDADGKLPADIKRALAPAIKEIRAERQAEKTQRREEREAELGRKITALPDKRYGVIVADPEWQFEPYSRDTGMDRAADNHYPTSSVDDICARPVGDIAAKDCVLFLWATAPMLKAALKVMEAWGFDYKSHAIWRKDRVGTGYWFRSRHELVLVGTRGDVPAPAFIAREESVFDAPVGEHSQKPDWLQDNIDSWYPSLPKIELNARRKRPGWDAWGFEAPEEIADAAHGSTASAVADAAALPAASAPNSNLPSTPIMAGGAAASLPESIHPAAATPITAEDDELDIPAFLRRAS
jgi:N6-adenosine-specific RNA methylase IME4